MNRTRLLIGLLLAALLAAGLYLLATQTEWVEQEVPLPPRGEAARDDWYAAQALLRHLGVPVQRQSHLDTLPHPTATLWLESEHWNLFPERVERLRQWVQQGGHLVVRVHHLRAQEPLAQWAPVSAVRQPDNPKPPAAASQPPSPRAFKSCKALREPTHADSSATYKVCDGFSKDLSLSSAAPALWSLQEVTEAGADPEIAPADQPITTSLRVAYGSGRFTAMGRLLVGNHNLADHDNAAILVATLDVRPGQALWLITEESRPPLLTTLWQRGAPVLLLAALALAFALWRAGSRLGPTAATPAAARRSVAEQVRGTARFVWNHSPAALLSAQQRATDAAALTHIPGYRLMSVPQRATALAPLTGLAAAELTPALDPLQTTPSAHHLAVLELARRRLAQRRAERTALAPVR